MTFSDLSPLANHLWQSTIFAFTAWLLTLALRKNRASVRYWVWGSESVKFLIPFSLLISIGNKFARHTASVPFVFGETGSNLKNRIRIIASRRSRGELTFARMARLVAVGIVAIAFSMLSGTAGGQSILAQAQSAAATQPAFKYDVVSVKPSGPEYCAGRPGFCRPTETPDGFHGVTSLKVLIHMAVGATTEDQLQGAPGWTNESRGFEINAKMDEATADALQKLSPAARKLARQQMLQAVLAERFKLVVHRETKELPVYLLFVGKNGTKLQQSNADFKLPNGDKPPAFMSGGVSISEEAPDAYLVLGVETSMDRLVDSFSGMTGRKMVDKTGLTGTYDFEVRFSTGDSQPSDAIGGGANLPSPPPLNRDSMPLAAIRALGFRLESGKAPVEVIFIDHVERPSGN